MVLATCNRSSTFWFAHSCLLSLLTSTLLSFSDLAFAQTYPPFIDIGAPVLREIYVDPRAGSDSSSGASEESALKTLSAAWRRIPEGRELTNGFRINILPGVIPESGIPNYLESRYGTATAPITIRSVDGPDSVLLEGDLNVFDTRYLYLIGITIRPSPAGDTFHCEQCTHILLRGNEFDGGDRAAHETIKFNQSQHIYLERNVIHGAADNVVDFVAVQYGHIMGNRIFNSEDWCTYVKGGSAYIRVEANEFFNCGTGGFTAGQGTGFEFMTAPWLHYEAYDIKFVNNIVHNTEGAAVGVNGGINILVASNTFYRVGSRSHGIEVVFGSRSCDGDTARCAERLALGGWGVTASGDEVAIPNQNVIIANNILYNPAGFKSRYQHFAIYRPRSTGALSNVPSPARSDSGLVIKGNVLWNGAPALPLGIEDNEQGCVDLHPTCSEAKLLSDNLINTLEPGLVDPSNGDFRILPGSQLSYIPAVSIEPFPSVGRPASPLAPVGELSNFVAFDRAGSLRTEADLPGAFIRNAQLTTPTPTPTPGARIRIRIGRIDKQSRSSLQYMVRLTATLSGAENLGLLANVRLVSSNRGKILGVSKISQKRFLISGRLRRGLYRIQLIAHGAEGASGTLTKRLRV
jgi:hypothetical protein